MQDAGCDASGGNSVPLAHSQHLVVSHNSLPWVSLGHEQALGSMKDYKYGSGTDHRLQKTLFFSTWLHRSG